MIQSKTGIIVVVVGLLALYTFYTPPANEVDNKISYPEFYWYNEVTGKTQWEEPIYEYESEEGETYWIDPDTGKATWEKPASLGWIAAEEPGSKIYYWNDVTEATQWEKPANLGWVKVRYQPPGDEQGGEPDNSEL